MAAESALKFFISMMFFDDGCWAAADKVISKENMIAEYGMVVFLQRNAANVCPLRDLDHILWW